MILSQFGGVSRLREVCKSLAERKAARKNESVGFLPGRRHWTLNNPDRMTDNSTQSETIETKTVLKAIVNIPGLLWLDLDDPMSHELDDLAARYGFHELAVEDCRHDLQLAKIDYYDGYTFIIINSTHYTDKPCEVKVREFDAFLGP